MLAVSSRCRYSSAIFACEPEEDPRTPETPFETPFETAVLDDVLAAEDCCVKDEEDVFLETEVVFLTAEAEDELSVNGEKKMRKVINIEACSQRAAERGESYLCAAAHVLYKLPSDPRAPNIHT